jgi:hypothetical protein
VQEQLKLHNLRRDHIVIQWQLKYLIGVKFAGTVIYSGGPGLTRPQNCWFMSGPDNKPAKTAWVGLHGMVWPRPRPSGPFQPEPKPGNPEPLITRTMLDGCTVATMWELLRLLRDAQRGRSNTGWWCKSNTPHRKPSSLCILSLVLRFVVHEVLGHCRRWRLGRFVFVDQQMQVNQQSIVTRVCKTFLPTFTSIVVSSHALHTAHILHSLITLRPAYNNTSPSNTHPIRYTTLNFPSRVASTTYNWLIILTLLIQTHCILNGMAAQRIGKAHWNAMATMPTLVINWCQ